MLFNSLHFFVFFPIVTLVYFFIPYRFRWAWLLAASYYFYMCWRFQYVALLIVTTLIDYWAGLKMDETQDRARRRGYLLLSILSNLGLLFFFKYFGFVNGSLSALFKHFDLRYPVSMIQVLLPVGISFHTFQGLSYSIDIYQGVRKPERHLGLFALFIAFFPQMVAGPIERAHHLIPQFRRTFDFDYRRVTNGLKLMAWGFFKKLVIADALAATVDAVFKSPRSHLPFDLIVAAYFFAFQIYCDFSGYTDIARGAAQAMGFHLTYNFNRPYFAKSIPEFWKRWHISLSSWFRDYLYIPLGGNRVSPARWGWNIFLVFLLSGLWHGANWTYVAWGGLHGLFYLASVRTEGWRRSVIDKVGLSRYPRLHRAMKVFLTFHLVTLAWIFFRANSLADAAYMVGAIFQYPITVLTRLHELHGGNHVLGYRLLKPVESVALAAVLLMELLHLWQRSGSVRIKLLEKPFVFRWSCYAALVLSILLCGELQVRQFIYFQF